MDEITDRQKEILTFIQTTTEERGFPPTIREIGEEMIELLREEIEAAG
jgi:repressor LexA